MSSKQPFVPNARPRSFKDRGVAVPFTTPLLEGARFRRTETVLACPGERGMMGARSGMERAHIPPLEIIVRNPSSGRGVYILPWAQIDSLCRPTEHDTMLGQAISLGCDHPNAALTPAFARETARGIALQGLAGPLAAKAAAHSALAQSNRMAATRLTLLMDLIEQTEPPSGKRSPLFQETHDEIERRGTEALATLALCLGQPCATMKGALEDLAFHYVDIGVGFARTTASLPTLLASVACLHHDMLEWMQRASKAETKPAMPDCRHATAIASASRLILRMSAASLAEAGARVGNIASLLEAQVSRPAETAERLAWTSWLLDEWDQIVPIWQCASTPLNRLESLRKINDRLSLLPDGTAAWLGLPPAGPRRFRQALRDGAT